MTKKKIIENKFILKSMNKNQLFDLEPNIDTKSELPKTKNTKHTTSLLNEFENNSNLKTKGFDHSVLKQNSGKRMTRGKTIKRITEERKQLNQLILDKFPNVKFKIFSIRLKDIYEEIKFLKTLGLKYRFACPLTTRKSKKRL